VSGRECAHGLPLLPFQDGGCTTHRYASLTLGSPSRSRNVKNISLFQLVKVKMISHVPTPPQHQSIIRLAVGPAPLVLPLQALHAADRHSRSGSVRAGADVRQWVWRPALPVFLPFHCVSGCDAPDAPLACSVPGVPGDSASFGKKKGQVSGKGPLFAPGRLSVRLSAQTTAPPPPLRLPCASQRPYPSLNIFPFFTPCVRSVALH